MNLKLTDSEGKPFSGSTVVAIYDKAVEYISGGSNVDNIKACFWKWQRSHYPQTESNLGREFWNLVPLDQASMSDLGMFGGSIADESMLTKAALGAVGRGAGGGRPGMARAMNFACACSGGLRRLPLRPPLPRPGENPPWLSLCCALNFADTALWVGSLTTDENGAAQLAVSMPDSLTTWRVRSWSLGRGTRVGQGDVGNCHSQESARSLAGYAVFCGKRRSRYFPRSCTTISKRPSS